MKDNAVYRKMQVHLKPYTPKKKIEPPELCPKDIGQSLDNNQNTGINQRPKHNVKPLNRLDL